MMTFREFLHKKTEEQQHPERRQRLDDWAVAVSQLINQLRTWLRESDPDGLLHVSTRLVQKFEPGLGAFSTPVLEIAVGDATARVEPVARNAVGVVERRGEPPVRAEGRVDITDGSRKYILYRTIDKEGKDTWYALDERFEAAPLDRAKLEAILQDLLS
jgi:hypothetical protein